MHTAKERVLKRYEIDKGHFVPDDQVEDRFKRGYDNINNLFREFDSIKIIDATEYKTNTKTILILVGGYRIVFNDTPEYLEKYIPNILNLPLILNVKGQ